MGNGWARIAWHGFADFWRKEREKIEADRMGRPKGEDLTRKAYGIKSQEQK